MRKNLLLLFTAAVLSTTTIVGHAYSTRAATITEEQTTIIKNSCAEIRSSLIRLEQSDKLLRTNRGQLYNTISDKLMVPFNQRLSSNQLDGGELVRTAANYSDAYQSFYSAYQQYDTSMTEAIDTNCQENPEQFYTNIASAREDRIVLYEANQKLVELAEQYYSEFRAFSTEFKKDNP